MAEATATLRALLERVAREQRYQDPTITIRPISTAGGNYTSELFLATIAAPSRPDLKLFAKEANIKGQIRDDVPITQFYEAERFVYETLVGIYAELEEKRSVPAEHRLQFPRYYGCHPTPLEETIVLEDLTARGFATADRLRPITWPYARAAVAQLAKLHALSFAYEADDPVEFAKVIQARRFRFNQDDERMKAVWGSMVANVLAATQEQHRERLGRYLQQNMKSMREHYEPLRRPVLVHGDYRPSNLMHRPRAAQEGGLQLQVVPVDYQTLRAGCAATDLLYLVFTGTDAAFRRQHYAPLLEEYYAELQAALRRLGLCPDRVYSREDFDFELKESLPYGLAVAVFVLPLVTVEAARAPRLADMALDTWHVDTSALFAERLNGIVQDYVDWGII